MASSLMFLPGTIESARRKKKVGGRLCTQADLAAGLDISTSHIQKVEHGQRRLEDESAEKLAAFLDVELLSLLDTRDEQTRVYAENRGRVPRPVNENGLTERPSPDLMDYLRSEVAYWRPGDLRPTKLLDDLVAATRPGLTKFSTDDHSDYCQAVLLRGILRLKVGELRTSPSQFRETVKDLISVRRLGGAYAMAARYLHARVCHEGTANPGCGLSRYELFKEACEVLEPLKSITRVELPSPLPLPGALSDLRANEIIRESIVADPLALFVRLPARYSASFATQAAFECKGRGSSEIRDEWLGRAASTLKEHAPPGWDTPQMKINFTLVESLIPLDRAISTPNARTTKTVAAAFDTLLDEVEENQYALQPAKYHEWSASCWAVAAQFGADAILFGTGLAPGARVG